VVDAGPGAITAAADDFGHMTHLVPVAVVTPGSAEDVADVIWHAAPSGLIVRPRGAGYSVAGQAQCDGGIVCDLAGLDQISLLGPDRISVGAGARWSTVLSAALHHGLTPPVLTNYLGLSAGGTLATGGIGGASHLYGPQVDHVLELEVVTPGGEIVVCSPGNHEQVFFSALAGQGRSGIITRATIPLVPAPQRVRVFKIRVPSLATFVACQLRLARARRFGYVEGQIAASGSGGWEYVLEIGAFYSGYAPDDRALLDGLTPDEVTDFGYEAFCHRMMDGVRRLAATGDWYQPHPWLSVFLPVHEVGWYVSEALATLAADTAGPVPILLYPLRRGLVPAPGLETPAADRDGLFYSLSILRTVPGTAEAIGDALRSNRELAEKAIASDGTVYPISALESAGPLPAAWTDAANRQPDGGPPIIARMARSPSCRSRSPPVPAAAWPYSDSRGRQPWS
jgi:FAD/FMN-containing dehydrogenase